jgi:hypothetical protein
MGQWIETSARIAGRQSWADDRSLVTSEMALL